MFIKMNQMMFIFSLMAGSLLAISSNSWFTAWLGLEINLLSMLPLMLNKLSTNSTDSAIKYFLPQALASTILIFSSSMIFLSSSLLSLTMSENIIMVALIIKAGIPPFHHWFPQVIKTLNWVQNFILFTWQKIAPLLLISEVNLNKTIIIAMVGVSAGALGGLNQVMIKPLMAYSAIAHSSWILIACTASNTTWFSYFLMYSSISFCILAFLQKYPISKLMDIPFIFSNKLEKNMLTFNMLSMAGLPPFLGFLAKINIILFMMLQKMILTAVIFIGASLVSLYFYYRVCYKMVMNKTTSVNNQEMFCPHSTSSTLVIASAMNIIIPTLSLLT